MWAADGRTAGIPTVGADGNLFGIVRGATATLLRVVVSGFAVTALVNATEVPAVGSESGQVLQFLEDRVRQDPDDFIAQNRLAGIYLGRVRETGSYRWLQKARAAVKRSLESVPAAQNAEGLWLVGRVEQESHQFAAARDAALALVKIEPAKSRAFVLLTDALVELGDVDEAARACEEAERRGASRYELESRRARLKLARGEFAEARTHLENALASAAEFTPPEPEIVIWCHLQLGQIAFRTGDWDRAEKHYATALELRPENPHGLEHLAELRGAQEKYGEAAALYDKVISPPAASGVLAGAGRSRSRSRKADGGGGVACEGARRIPQGCGSGERPLLPSPRRIFF